MPRRDTKASERAAVARADSEVGTGAGAGAETSDRRAKSQRFDAVEIERAAIRAAPYNLRTITDEARKRLRRSLHEDGLVMPLVWNRRTGNLVAGHQRLALLDATERRSDYTLTVSAIDVDERTERRLNVRLNNESLMGAWDQDALRDILDQSDLTLDELGFDPVSAEILFPDLAPLGATSSGTPVMERTKETLAALRAEQDKSRVFHPDRPSYNADYYFTVVCRSPVEKAEILASLGLDPADDMIPSTALVTLVGSRNDQPPAA